MALSARRIVVLWLAGVAVEEVDPRAVCGQPGSPAVALWQDSGLNIQRSDPLGNPLAGLQVCKWPEAQGFKW